jgi:hypothetical protein
MPIHPIRKFGTFWAGPPSEPDEWDGRDMRTSDLRDLHLASATHGSYDLSQQKHSTYNTANTTLLQKHYPSEHEGTLSIHRCC